MNTELQLIEYWSIYLSARELINLSGLEYDALPKNPPFTGPDSHHSEFLFRIQFRPTAKQVNTHQSLLENRRVVPDLFGAEKIPKTAVALRKSHSKPQIKAWMSRIFSMYAVPRVNTSFFVLEAKFYFCSKKKYAKVSGAKFIYLLSWRKNILQNTNYKCLIGTKNPAQCSRLLGCRELNVGPGPAQI